MSKWYISYLTLQYFQGKEKVGSFSSPYTLFSDKGQTICYSKQLHSFRGLIKDLFLTYNLEHIRWRILFSVVIQVPRQVCSPSSRTSMSFIGSQYMIKRQRVCVCVCVCALAHASEKQRERKGSIRGLEMATRTGSGTSHMFIYISLARIQLQRLINCQGAGKDTLSVCSETQILVSNTFLCHKVTVKTQERLPSTFPGILGSAKSIPKKMWRGLVVIQFITTTLQFFTYQKKEERDIEIKKPVSGRVATVTHVS